MEPSLWRPEAAPARGRMLACVLAAALVLPLAFQSDRPALAQQSGQSQQANPQEQARTKAEERFQQEQAKAYEKLKKEYQAQLKAKIKIEVLKATGGTDKEISDAEKEYKAFHDIKMEIALYVERYDGELAKAESELRILDDKYHRLFWRVYQNTKGSEEDRLAAANNDPDVMEVRKKGAEAGQAAVLLLGRKVQAILDQLEKEVPRETAEKEEKKAEKPEEKAEGEPPVDSPFIPWGSKKKAGDTSYDDAFIDLQARYDRRHGREQSAPRD